MAKRAKTFKNRRRTTMSQLMILVGLLGLLYIAWQVNYQPVTHAEPSVQVPVVVAKPSNVTTSLQHSNATELQIPDIGVNAQVINVGKKADGTIQVPSDPSQVGQYQNAPSPGEIGPAIIVGHVDSMKGPAVFWRLHLLQPGETIKIVRADGTIATFKINKVENFSQENFPTQEVYGNLDYPGLRLITCGGSFNYLTRHYSDNTVVFATLVQ